MALSYIDVQSAFTASISNTITYLKYSSVTPPDIECVIENSSPAFNIQVIPIVSDAFDVYLKSTGLKLSTSESVLLKPQELQTLLLRTNVSALESLAIGDTDFSIQFNLSGVIGTLIGSGSTPSTSTRPITRTGLTEE